MLLISDSGATKADWVALDEEGNHLFTTSTVGLNPEVITKEVLLDRIRENSLIMDNRHNVSAVYFYGAGCGTNRMRKFLKDIFSDIFSDASTITVKEDTYGAVFSTVNSNEPAIVCILGTGSNCCYWDGTNLHQKVESLGYILMDDSSGNYYGKQIIRDYYFNFTPPPIKAALDKEFDFHADSIKENVYKLSNPNKYLASFAKFMINHKKEVYFQKMISDGINGFIENYILQYKESSYVPVHFVGSVAFYLREEIRDILKNRNLNPGNILKKPIEGMVSFHKSHIIKS